MWTHAMSLFAAGAILAACSDPSGPGLVVVVTSTAAAGSDGNGYEVVVDSLDSLTIGLADTSQVSVQPGRHTLTLRGVPAHCKVTPGATLAVEVPPDGSVSVRFDVRCAGARITTRTTGTDLDRDGYRLLVNGADWGMIGLQDTVLARLEPGRWTLALTDLSSNCVVDGPTSREVTVLSAEVFPVDWSIVCTAATGVVEIIVTPTGPALAGESFFARIDNDDSLQKQTMETPGFVSVTIGNHVISLYGSNHCAVVGAESKRVTVEAGSTRDTVPVEFAVTCNVPQVTGMIWGQVLDSSGVCLRGGMVEIIDGPSAGQISQQPEECDAWDYEGFEFDDLPLGATVTLRASAPGYRPQDRKVVARNGGGPVQFVLIPK
jgi:hypothetical protein